MIYNMITSHKTSKIIKYKLLNYIIGHNDIKFDTVYEWGHINPTLLLPIAIFRINNDFKIFFHPDTNMINILKHGKEYEFNLKKYMYGTYNQWNIPKIEKLLLQGILY